MNRMNSGSIRGGGLNEAFISADNRKGFVQCANRTRRRWGNGSGGRGGRWAGRTAPWRTVIGSELYCSCSCYKWVRTGKRRPCTAAPAPRCNCSSTPIASSTSSMWMSMNSCVAAVAVAAAVVDAAAAAAAAVAAVAAG